MQKTAKPFKASFSKGYELYCLDYFEVFFFLDNVFILNIYAKKNSKASFTDECELYCFD